MDEDRQRSPGEIMSELLSRMGSFETEQEDDAPDEDLIPMVDNGNVVGYLRKDADQRVPEIRKLIREMADQYREKLSEPPAGEAATAGSLVYHLITVERYKALDLAQLLAVAVGMIAEYEGGGHDGT